jgi:ABC-type sugar transport system ATPase subunit
LPSQLAASATLDGNYEIGVRPEFLNLTAERPNIAALRVTVRRLAQLGGFNVASVTLGDHVMHVKTRSDLRPEPGADYWLTFPDKHTHVYQDGRLIA